MKAQETNLRISFETLKLNVFWVEALIAISGECINVLNGILAALRLRVTLRSYSLEISSCFLLLFCLFLD
jgi:hypothetical protein